MRCCQVYNSYFLTLWFCWAIWLIPYMYIFSLLVLFSDKLIWIVLGWSHSDKQSCYRDSGLHSYCTQQQQSSQDWSRRVSVNKSPWCTVCVFVLTKSFLTFLSDLLTHLYLFVKLLVWCGHLIRFSEKLFRLGDSLVEWLRCGLPGGVQSRSDN